MSTDIAYTGSIPPVYDRFLGPMLFAPYARDLASRVSRLRPTRLLELAAGTGIATRALLAALPDGVELVASDLNEAMIAHGSTRVADSRLRWTIADACLLPFEDQRFDAVVAQFGVMLFPNRASAYREAHRVLAPGGAFLFSVWDDVAHNQIPRIIARALSDAFPDDPPQWIERAPHGYFDPETIVRDVRAGGFANVEIEHVELSSRAPSAHDVAFGWCHGSPLRNEIVTRDGERLEDVTLRVAGALSAALGSGPIEVPMRALVITAR